MPTTVTGPFIKTADVAEYLSAVQQIVAAEVLDHARTTARHAVELLTSPAFADTSFRALCARAQVEPFTPLGQSLPRTLDGYAENAVVARLTPVTGGWVLTGAAQPGRQAASLYDTTTDRPVLGPALEVVANTGFPAWLTPAEICEDLGIDAETLAATPAQIRTDAGLSTEIATPAQIQRLLDGDAPISTVSRARREAAQLRSLGRQILLDSFAATGIEPTPQESQILTSDGLVGGVLAAFRAKSPDPANVSASLTLLHLALGEQVAALEVAERAHAERKERHRARAARPLIRD